MSKILDKIKKLYAKAESAKELNNLQEANLFFNKVQELLQKHQLELGDIHSYSTESDGITHEDSRDLKFGEVLSDGGWDYSLMGTICKYHFCDMIRIITQRKGATSTGTGYYRIIGTPDNIELCKYLYSLTYHLFKQLSSKKFNEVRKRAILCSTINISPDLHEDADELIYDHLCENHYEEFVTDLDKEFVIKMDNVMIKNGKARVRNPEKAKMISYRKVWIRSYLDGAVVGLGRNLSERQVQMCSDEQTTALIVNNEAALKNYMDDNLNFTTSKGSSKGGSDSSAYRQGVNDGKAAHLASGVSSNNGKVQATKLLK